MKKIILAAAIAMSAISAHAADALQISDLSATNYAGGQGTITGTATNVSTVRIENASIIINLLDAQGNIVGNTSAVGFGIEPGQRWMFRAPSTIRYDRAVIAAVKTQ